MRARRPVRTAGPSTTLLALVLLATAGCATTRLSAVWTDEAWRGGPFRKILVIGVSGNETSRRVFETEFSRQLRARGGEGVPAFSLDLPAGPVDKDAVMARVKPLGIDGVLVTRLVDRKTVATYYPPEQRIYVAPGAYHRGWYPYWSSSYEYVTRPGYTVTEETVVVETNLYETASERLVWSALTETFVGADVGTLIRGFVETLTADLAARRLI
jgi:hypothetical protein